MDDEGAWTTSSSLASPDFSLLIADDKDLVLDIESDEEPSLEQLDSQMWRAATRARYAPDCQTVSIIPSMFWINADMHRFEASVVATGKRHQMVSEAAPDAQRRHVVAPMAHPKVYTGDSATTAWRNNNKLKERAREAAGCKKLTDLFTAASHSASPTTSIEAEYRNENKVEHVALAEQLINRLTINLALLTLSLPSEPEAIVSQLAAISAETRTSNTAVSTAAEEDTSSKRSTASAATPIDTDPSAAIVETQFDRMNRLLSVALSQARKAGSVQHALDLCLLSEYNLLREVYKRDRRADPSSAATIQIASTQPGYKRAGKSLTRGLGFARTIQRRAVYFLEHGDLPMTTQGKGAHHS